MPKIVEGGTAGFLLNILTSILKSGTYRVRSVVLRIKTRRERPKSAQYLRLKNIQGTTIGTIWKKYFFFKKSIW